MKKVALIAVLFSMMTISAHAQWLDFSQNMNRAVFGIHIGPAGYDSFGELFKNSNTMPYGTQPWDFSNIGYGISVAIAGVYVDFLYVSPDHRFDSHVVSVDWPDHTALTINAGYQIPIFEDYVFITPMIGFSRLTTGLTEGNNIGVDPDSYSIFHKYTTTWSRNDFNYGGGITIVPCKWFELTATCTNHSAYAGVAFNLMNYQE